MIQDRHRWEILANETPDITTLMAYIGYCKELFEESNWVSNWNLLRKMCRWISREYNWCFSIWKRLYYMTFNQSSKSSLLWYEAVFSRFVLSQTTWSDKLKEYASKMRVKWGACLKYWSSIRNFWQKGTELLRKRSPQLNKQRKWVYVVFRIL